jgi:hypothetical protein
MIFIYLVRGWKEKCRREAKTKVRAPKPWPKQNNKIMWPNLILKRGKPLDKF